MNKGFTLIELVIVIVIIAIIAITAIPRLFDIGEARLDSAAYKVEADLRYAHEYAMNHNCRTKVDFASPTAANTYEVYEDSTGTWQIMQDPTTREDFRVNLNAGQYRGVLIASADFAGGSIVIFDSLGAPYGSYKQPLSSDGIVTLGYIGGAIGNIFVHVAIITGRIFITR